MGITLTDALDELIQSGQITPQLAMRILAQFYKSISESLAHHTRSKATLKGRLHTYRFCDDVWTFILDQCQIRMDEEIIHADKVKIVACNARKPNEVPAPAHRQ